MTLREKEKILLQKIKSGDKSAYIELVNPYRERLFRKAKSMLRDDDDAEDIVQDAMISGFKSISKFRAESGVYTWLYRIVVNKSKDLLQKKKREIEKPIDHTEQQFIDDRVGYEKKLELSDESSYLIRKIGQLDDIYKQVIELRYFEEMSYADIAAVLKCNVGTVKSRLFKARELLKHLILKDEKGEISIGP
ncbi:MAG: RNA polymerase sigma factor [Leptospiraceae bacterium]|nr:RNA polymerase sigma factor [Leptospiraceae bacterium]MCP5497546.1 RNA polymerase sigma factor [Leptospiraceae bacterium]